MKQSNYSFFSAHVATLLLALFSCVEGVNSQTVVTLPHECDFQSDEAKSQWSLQGTSTTESGYTYDGTSPSNILFRFSYQSHDAYLVSPILSNGEAGVFVSLMYYEISSSQYTGDQFQVGYTTDENVTDPSQFTYGEKIDTGWGWDECGYWLPGDVKRVAIKYVDNDAWYLCLDNFIIDTKPFPIKVGFTEVSYHSAQVVWTERGEATSWEICVDDDETNIISATTNSVSLTGLTPGTSHTVKVRSVIGNDKSNWSRVKTFSTLDDNPIATNVAVETTPESTTISWEGSSDNYKVRYRPVTCFSDDFEEGMGQWTIVKNGEGNEDTQWRAVKAAEVFNNSSYPAQSGDYVAMTRSWSSNAFNVDNWLISPQVQLEGLLTYWAMDDGTYHEHYDIYVSTTTNDISAFTLFHEPGDATNTWTKHTVDLSSFGGAMGYVAFRHIDNDKDWLFIDEVQIGTPSEWQELNTTDKQIELTGLDSNTKYEFTIVGVKEGRLNAGTKLASFKTPYLEITLADDADNSTVLAENDSKVANVTLTRTLKEGGWNTFAIPFNTAIPAEWTVKQLASSDLEDEMLTLNFEDAETIVAGTPYLVKVNADITNPTFNGVTIVNTTGSAVETTSANFVAAINPTAITAGKNTLFVANGNTLTWPAADATLPGLRAYFVLNNTANNARTFQMNFGDETTGIRTIGSTTTGNSAIYDIQGRRVANPTRGFYIVNGKKVVIK